MPQNNFPFSRDPYQTLQLCLVHNLYFTATALDQLVSAANMIGDYTIKGDIGIFGRDMERRRIGGVLRQRELTELSRQLLGHVS